MVGCDQGRGLAQWDDFNVLLRKAASLQFACKVFGISRDLSAACNRVVRHRFAEDLGCLLDIDLLGVGESWG